MSFPDFKHPPPSRLTLGTAQIGMNYGVANRTGRPAFATVVDILQVAHQSGIDTIDTAPGYGESEEWLGRALRELGLLDQIRVVTKIAPLAPNLQAAEAAAFIEASVVNSLKRLGLERLPVCVFHRDANITYADELLALRSKGLIEIAGVSLNNLEFAHKALTLPELKAWQIPANLLDRRFTDPNVAMKAVRSGVFIFARSAYLQGLLLMDDSSTPAHLHEIVAPRQALRDIAARFNMTIRELAFRAMISRADIHSVVVGVETVEQTRENIALVAKGPLSDEAFAAVEAFVPGIPEWLIMPFQWDKVAKAAKAPA